MNVNYHENIVCIDVDLTLVSPSRVLGEIMITNPYSGTENFYKIHHWHVEILKQYKGRGCFIRVWSHGGVKWAETVVKALGLEDYVDSIETKPFKLVDDLPAEKIFKNIIYIKDDGGEKS